MILIYISERNDEFLEKSFYQFKQYNLDTFKSSQISSILLFQQKLLKEKNKYKEILDSLKHILINKYELNRLTDGVKIMENLTIEAYEEKIDLYHFKNKESKKILEVYSNQIKEDIKNISRLIREIDNFMKLFNIILDENICT